MRGIQKDLEKLEETTMLAEGVESALAIDDERGSTGERGGGEEGRKSKGKGVRLDELLASLSDIGERLEELRVRALRGGEEGVGATELTSSDDKETRVGNGQLGQGGLLLWGKDEH